MTGGDSLKLFLKKDESLYTKRMGKSDGINE